MDAWVGLVFFALAVAMPPVSLVVVRARWPNRYGEIPAPVRRTYYASVPTWVVVVGLTEVMDPDSFAIRNLGFVTMAVFAGGYLLIALRQRMASRDE